MTAFLSAQLKAGDYVNTLWRVCNAAPETSVDDLLRPEAWAHTARMLKAHDEIVVVPQGAPYRAHLLVMEAGKNFAKMRLLSVVSLNDETLLHEDAPAAAPSLPEDAPLFVKWNGPADKFAVVRRSDGEKLNTGFAVKAEAESWASQHLAAMSA